RMQAARKLDHGYRELKGWLGGWETQAQKTLDLYRQTLTATKGQRPTSRHYARLVADWVALPWKPLLEPGAPSNGATGPEPSQEARHDPFAFARHGSQRGSAPPSQ